MSYSYQPKVVRDGLVFAVDAKNLLSVPTGNGTRSANFNGSTQWLSSTQPIFKVGDSDFSYGCWVNFNTLTPEGTNDDIMSYIDAVPNVTAATKIQGSSNSSNFYVGSRAGAFAYTGQISQVRIYNRALTPTEVKQNYDATKGRFI